MTTTAVPSSAIPAISAQRKSFAGPVRERDPRGDRYDHRAAFDPRTSLSRPARRKGPVEASTVAVADPHEPGKRVLASVNRRVDVLEMERSHNRITVSQYETGRQVQAILERSAGCRLGSAGWNSSGSRDQTIAHELAIIYAVEDARLVAKLRARIVGAIGEVPGRFLAEVLSGRKTFAQYAADRGKGGERGTAYIAEHFRILLEDLDGFFAAEGVATTIDRFFQGERTGEETDERGRVVPAGHGHAWGGEESRYAVHMNPDALTLRGRTAKVRDRVGARHRVTEG